MPRRPPEPRRLKRWKEPVFSVAECREFVNKANDWLREKGDANADADYRLGIRRLRRPVGEDEEGSRGEGEAEEEAEEIKP